MNRRQVLGFLGLAGLGLVAHHKPGHGHGRPPTTTTTVPTTTTTAPPPGPGVYGEAYTDDYEVAA